jgi:hypothetical protein
MKTDEVVNLLLRKKIAQPQEIVGCTEEEISELEQRVGLTMPTAYRDFLRTMGHRAGSFMVGTDFFYDGLLGLRDSLVESLAQMRVDFQMPSDLFVFSSHQGYIFIFSERLKEMILPCMDTLKLIPTVRQRWPTFSDALFGFAEESS